MLVEQLMNRPPITCGPDDSLSDAARLMWDNDCGALPVVDGDGRAIGMITDRDICMAAYHQGLPLHGMTVVSAMSRDVHCCRPGDPIGVAEKIMTESQVRRVPVVDAARRVIGFLSLADLARDAEQESGRRRPDVSDADVSRTLAAIAQPHREEHIVPVTDEPRPGL